jgi:hypothetical protein
VAPRDFSDRGSRRKCDLSELCASVEVHVPDLRTVTGITTLARRQQQSRGTGLTNGLQKNGILASVTSRKSTSATTAVTTPNLAISVNI